MLEVFAQNGRLCITRVIDANPTDVNTEIVAMDGAVRVEKLTSWPVKAAGAK